MNKIIVAICLNVALCAPAFAQKKKQIPPIEGAEFKLSPDAPKYVTCDIEFRDPKDEKWPNFFYGKASAAGKFVWSPKGPQGSFAITFDKMAQRNGEQDRKVLGELLAGGAVPAVSLVVQGFGDTVVAKDEKGKPSESFPVKAELKVGDKAVGLGGVGRVKWNYAKDAESPESGQLTLSFIVDGVNLGLKGVDAVQVTAFVTAFKDLPTGKK